MKLDTTALLSKLQPLQKYLKQYGVFAFILVFLGTYVYLVLHIGKLIQAEPNPSTETSDIKPVNRLKIDKNAVSQMTELETQNVDVQSLFKEARDNPFTE